MGKIVANVEDESWIDSSIDKNFDFPIEVFPVQIQNIITDYEKYLNFPVEFTSASIIAVTSATLGNTIELEFLRGWKTTAVLAAIIVQNRGHAKSHPMKAIFRPLLEKEEAWFEEHKLLMTEYVAELETYKEDKRKKRTVGDEPVPPLQKRITVQRFTPEVLVKIHCENPRGIIVFSDEAKSWFGTFNQYSNSADEQMWCNFLNGDSFNRDTITHGNWYLPKAFVSVIGGIQPVEFQKFIKDNTENGLFDRICYFYPQYLEDEEWPEDSIPQFTIDNWFNIYNRLFDTFKFEGIANIKTIKYQPEAVKILRKWQKNLTKLKGERDSVFKGIAAKAESNIHRLSLILLALDSVCNNSSSIVDVPAPIAEKAVILQNYFIEEALKVRELSNDNTVKFKDIWYSLLPEKFNSEEAVAVATKHKLCSRRSVFNWLKDSRILKESTDSYKKLVQ